LQGCLSNLRRVFSPSYAAFILKTNIAEQWLKSALDRGNNAGAVKGKAVTIDLTAESIV
jgi:hypothetical protein